MPKFNCSYAYDIPHYVDFVVEAENEADAEKKIQAALSDKSFSGATGDSCWENMCNERVFISGEIDESTDDYIADKTMDQLIEETKGVHK